MNELIDLILKKEGVLSVTDYRRSSCIVDEAGARVVSIELDTEYGSIIIDRPFSKWLLDDDQYGKRSLATLLYDMSIQGANDLIRYEL